MASPWLFNGPAYVEAIFLFLLELDSTLTTAMVLTGGPGGGVGAGLLRQVPSSRFDRLQSRLLHATHQVK